MNETWNERGAASETAAEFRRQVRMAAVQVLGLGRDELAQALAYEVEPLSGIPAEEAEVDFQPVDDADQTVRVYEVTVRRRDARAAAKKGATRWLKVAFAAAALVLVALLVDALVMSGRLAAQRRAVAERRPLEARLESLRGELSAARNETSALRERRAAAARAQVDVADARSALAALLSDLSATCGARAVVTAVKKGDAPQTLVVTAVGESAEAAADVMRELARRAGARGQRLVPGVIAAGGSGTAVDYSFTFESEKGGR